MIYFNLVECKDLKAALSRSMASWAAQHEFINFVDVTEECTKLQGTLNSSCPLVELWITRRPASELRGITMPATMSEHVCFGAVRREGGGRGSEGEREEGGGRVGGRTGGRREKSMARMGQGGC